MAREMGQRSFLAEEVYFSKSGMDGKDGSPWKLLQRLIPQNILLAAYRNPMSLEELSMELGVSMPYMEEEVALLTGGTLLQKLKDGRFETHFIIVDKQMQQAIFEKLLALSESFGPLLLELLDCVWASPGLHVAFGRNADPSKLYWTLVPLLIDFCIAEAGTLAGVPGHYTARPHEGKWDLVGYEKHSLPFSMAISHDGVECAVGIARLYRMDLAGLFMRDLPGPLELSVISRLLERDGDRILPTFPVFSATALKQWQETFALDNAALDMRDRLAQLLLEHYRFACQTIGQGIPTRLQGQVKFVAGQYLFNFRMTTLRQCYDGQRLRQPTDEARRSLGFYVILD